MLLLIAATGETGSPDEFPDEEMDRLIEKGDELILEGEYAQALEVLGRISELRPDHPAGYFWQARVWERWMADEQDYSLEDRFYASTDSAIGKGERMVAEGTRDPWVYAFLGGAYELRSMYEAQRKRWWTALRDAWLGVGKFKESLRIDPNLYDAYAGIGVYVYWRSRLTKDLGWLPLVKDERAKGIGLLRIAAERSRYSRVGVKCQLLWIMIAEKEFAEATKMGEELYAQYPKSPTIIFGYATALLASGKLKEAEKVYKRALEVYETRDNAHPYAVTCRLGLAKIYFRRGEMREVETECQRILEYDRAQRAQSLSDSKIEEAEKLLKAARRGR